MLHTKEMIWKQNNGICYEFHGTQEKQCKRDFDHFTQAKM